MNRREPLAHAEKALLVQRKRAGATLAQIATELGCAMDTARKWWRYQRHGHVPRPRGRPARGVLSTYLRAVRDLAVAAGYQRVHTAGNQRGCQHRTKHMASWTAFTL